MFKFRSSCGKILVHSNPKELFVEFKLAMHMLVLLIWLLLLDVQLNPEKITVTMLALCRPAFKFLSYNLLWSNLYNSILF